MDFILEVFDTYAFDPLYAALLPITPNAAFPGLSGNASYAGYLQAASGSITNGFEYKPSSSFISFEPGAAAYMSQWPRDYVWRQALSLYLITAIFGCVTYFFFATLSYLFIFDKTAFNHPRYLKNQMAMEIRQSCTAMPVMAILTVPAFLLEVRGYSKMYDTTAEGPGRWYDFLQFPLFFLFTDTFIYWIHRGLHHPLVYKRLHKPHHKWIVPTPFASHAFHPLDGFAQSVPYHVFPFVLPLQKFAYVALFVFVNIWTVMIHDGEYAWNSKIINGAACHTLHHLYFNFNYGQFTTLWDRIGGSYRKPNVELFLKEEKNSNKEWERQTKEMQKIVDEVEGSAQADRVYLNDKRPAAAAAAKKAQ